ncbi:hypothetical protein RCH21_000789 [Arthrobacter sp. PL16]|nr:hypothetical protein [Arthrobacter sp. PL16]
MEPAEINAAVKAERHHLRDFLEGIGEAEWTTRSLCSA